ncbi:putative type-1 restriction enzyme specificity protein [Clostridium puniceum]|uniref:Putative type-1 restriction enzyme specificity protein n=1 Tax=Clostridium puniceum TaxID=29367 RepID=A0A1S8TVY9_9CLOT|nr:restriction endonuclease subunit S [Clostridium puniceum]OOM81900.1 putative type-1 restriction enzyme specificity protein [Clostridium puniceum]
MVENIPEGYKKTEVGVIPEEWDVTEWENVATGFSSGATPSRAKPEYFNGDIKWVTSGELNYNIIFDTIEKITKDAKDKTNLTILPPGTFLMAITGLEAAGTRGSCGILGTEATTNQSCMAIFSTDKLDTKYLYHYYVFQGENLALKYCQGTKQQSYTGKIVKKLPIIIPQNKEEQIVVANVLSDIDSLISSLEKLIYKKKNIKQGAMQELLTGNKRLEGFSEKWFIVRLGDILKIGHGKLQHDIVDINGKYPILGTGGIIGRTNSYLYNKPSVLIGRKGTIDVPQYMDTPFWTIDTLFYTKLNENVNAKYIYYLFCMLEWAKYNEASGVPSLSAKTIEAIEFNKPSLDEQTAIAQILSDMDTEIEKLNAKLNKYKDIKQGMMQELLTGKRRLI